MDSDGMKKTLVLGASLNAQRYSYKAVLKLRTFNQEVIAFGLRNGHIADVPVVNEWEYWNDVHTVTLYMNAERQKDYYHQILALKPKRVLFNPGAENEELSQMLQKQGIEVENACTLILLSIGTY